MGIHTRHEQPSGWEERIETLVDQLSDFLYKIAEKSVLPMTSPTDALTTSGEY